MTMDWTVSVSRIFCHASTRTASQHASAIRFRIVCPGEYDSFIRSALCRFVLKLLVLRMMLHISFRWPYCCPLYAHCCFVSYASTDETRSIISSTRSVPPIFVVQFSTELSYVQSCCEHVICIFEMFSASGTRLSVYDTQKLKKKKKRN